MDENCPSSTLAPIIMSVLCFVIWKVVWEQASRFFKCGARESIDLKSSKNDIVEIKATTLKIARDWMELTKLIDSVHDDRNNFVNLLQTELGNRNEKFLNDIAVSLQEKFLEKDQEFSEIKIAIETIQEDILLMKEGIQKLAKIADICEEKKSKMLADNCVQTDYEVKKRSRESQSKIGTNSENEASKLLKVVKKCLIDLMKDTKFQLFIDREEENRQLQILFSKLAEDREEIKKTIFQTFSLAVEQTKRKFEEFEHSGQQAMNYIAVQNENTNKILNIKLEDTEVILKKILNTLNSQNFDVLAIREILENIDGQFDDIFQRIESECQKNTEHCEEITENLEKEFNHSKEFILNLKELAKDFTSTSKAMKNMLNEMKSAIDSVTEKDAVNKQVVNSGGDEIMKNDAITSIATKDLVALSQKHRNLIFMYSVIETCWEKLTSMNSRVENGCEEICQLVQTLAHRLKSINQAVEKLDKIIRDIDMENLRGKIVYARRGEVSSDNIDHSARNNMLDAGDCQLPTLESTKTIMANETLPQNVQNAIAIDKEVEMVDLILQKICEKRRINFFKNTPSTEAETPESSIYQVIAQDDALGNSKDDGMEVSS